MTDKKAKRAEKRAARKANAVKGVARGRVNACILGGMGLVLLIIGLIARGSAGTSDVSDSGLANQPSLTYTTVQQTVDEDSIKSKMTILESALTTYENGGTIDVATVIKQVYPEPTEEEYGENYDTAATQYSSLLASATVDYLYAYYQSLNNSLENPYLYYGVLARDACYDEDGKETRDFGACASSGTTEASSASELALFMNQQFVVMEYTTYSYFVAFFGWALIVAGLVFMALAPVYFNHVILMKKDCAGRAKEVKLLGGKA